MKINNIKTLLVLSAILMVFNSCKKDYESIESIDEAKIQAYIKQNNIPAVKDPNGYYYQIIDKGLGGAVKNADSVYYSYTFKSLTGKVFSQTTDISIAGDYLGYSDRFIINGSNYLITPFREVLSQLNRGGKATMILPSFMAFGKNGITSLGIGSNEILLVDLGIYNVSKKHEAEDIAINAFIAKNNLNLTKINAAYYNIITPGTGNDIISVSSTIKAKYTVRFLNGAILEQSTDGNFSSKLSSLYKGWQLVLPSRVTKGGKLRLVIPSALGGGTSPLDFDIEIVDVTN